MFSLRDTVITAQYHHVGGLLHDHELIKNEDYHAREGDLCYGCGLLLHKSGVVYHCVNFSSAEKDNDCAHFFLHKTCALLPLKLDHSGHKNHVLFLQKRPTVPASCNVCGIELKWFAYYSRSFDCPNGYQICLACVLPLTNTNISTPYHAHKLTLVPRLAQFQCDVCHSVDTDFSYMCYTCPFWIHLGCSKLQAVLECKIHHKHPLTLAYSLPQNYRSFPKPCRICKEELDPTDWLYYCLSCRFFAHTKCATSPPPNKQPDYPYTKRDFVQIPVPEHDPLLQQCIKKKSISWLDDDTVTPPNHINHWSHNHQLLLKNKSELSSTDEEGKSPICNGCTDSIFTNDDVFFECRECNYVLHRHCAQFPIEMKRHMEGFPRELVGIQASVYDLWSCTYCGCLRNGIQMQFGFPWYQGDSKKLDIGCALLPREIKHQAHSHRLVQSNRNYHECNCIACNKNVSKGDAVLDCDPVLGLARCKFPLHVKCALKPLTVTHPWDPHPLHLICSPDQIEDHPHEYECELCSQEIDADHWFYHCDVCDLSFHFGECMDQYFRYSKVKFGATNIKIEAHQHGLTFVLNKKRRLPCQRCRADTFNQPVLQCTPCKFIQHAHPDLCS